MSKQLPPQAYVRSYLLNNLRYEPVPRETLLEFGESERGFVRAAIEEEARRLGIISQEIHGEEHWVRPANLVAIWWGNRPAHYYEPLRQSGGGSAA